MASKAEIAFRSYWDEHYKELFPMVPEYKFHPARRWRVDFVNLEYKLAVEVQGWAAGGGHGGSRQSLSSDTEKHQQLAILGWAYFPILASECTKRIDVAVLPVLEWINTRTPVRLREPGSW